MTPYHELFVPIFLVGCVVALAATFFAARSVGCIFPGMLLSFGMVALWVATFIGSDMGYRHWQSMPDPPDEAFSDASVVGALLFGWLPSGIFCLMFFAFFRSVRWFLNWANPDALPLATDREVPPVESGNPYQSPSSK